MPASQLPGLRQAISGPGPPHELNCTDWTDLSRTVGTSLGNCKPLLYCAAAPSNSDACRPPVAKEAYGARSALVSSPRVCVRQPESAADGLQGFFIIPISSLQA